ncbi:MAG: TonB-dependent receptor [Muribaculaceae bacterium]|nr:TonB-dependent receptor [Muribaculaceae bacterium]
MNQSTLLLRRCMLLGIVFTSGAPLYASSTESHRDTLKLKEVIVTAPLKSNPDLIPLNVTQISEASIEKSGESSLMPILVTKVPGLFVTERGFAGYGVSGGSAGSVNIRGVGQSNKVLFMIDGQPQWAGVFGHSMADTYVANGIEKVEVVKGPSSLLYGSNAMGGSVNLVTQTQKSDGLTGRARAMFGSFSTQKFALSSGYKKGRFSATLSGQLDRSNGNRAGSAFWLANEFAQLKYAISNNWSIAGMLDMTQSHANNPGTLQDPLENMWTDIFRGTGGLYVKNNYGKFDGGIQGYINWGRHNVDDGNTPGSLPKDYLFHSTDYNMGLTAYESFYLWQANILSAGIDFQHWGGHVWNTNKEDESIRTSESKHHVNEIAGYIMMQQGFFNDILNINGGVRLQHGSSYGNVWVPQAGFIVRPGHNARIKASFSKGFRAPNIRELYLYPPANPELKPEYMLNYEISYRQYFLNSRFMIGAAIFYIDGKDMIQTIRIDGRPKNVNTGKFHNKGFEIESSYSILENLSAYAAWSYLHTDSDNLYSPKNKLNISMTYSPGSFDFTLEEISIWSLNNGNPTGKTENYSLLNLRAAYTLKSKVPVTLSVKLDNITNKHYQIIYGCPMPGTTILGGVEFKF